MEQLWIPMSTVTRIAESQRGTVMRSQLVEAGVSGRSINRMVEAGQLLKLFPKVYRFGGSPVDWLDRVQGAVSWGGKDAVASHRCATRLHGLTIKSEVVEITVPQTVKPPPGIKVHYSCIDPADVRRIQGINVTSLPRTLLTLGGVVPPSLLEKLMDEALIGSKATSKALVDVLMREGRRGMKGVASFRRLLEQRIALPEEIRTELERRISSIVREAKLPMPVAQHKVMVRDESFSLDFAYPELKVAIEGDGHQFHLMRGVRESDTERQNLLSLEGWLFLRFTWAMVTRQPKAVAEMIRDAIAIRGAERGLNFS